MWNCECQVWSLQALVIALDKMERRESIMPEYRHTWTASEEAAFIDSLMKGYPIGNIVLYRRIHDNKSLYVLIDGVNRAHAIQKYIHQGVAVKSGIDFFGSLLIRQIPIIIYTGKVECVPEIVSRLNPVAHISTPTLPSEPRVKDTGKALGAAKKKVEIILGDKLVHVKMKAYRTEDHRKGYVFLESMPKNQSKYCKYWYGYKMITWQSLKDCQEVYVVICCKDTHDAYALPISWVEERKQYMSYSGTNVEGVAYHWHIDVHVFKDTKEAFLYLPRREADKLVSIEQFKI